LSGYAEVLIQVGEADTAYKALMRCIELSPEGDGTPYLNLAQISEGLDAVGYFTKGIELLVKKRAALFAEVRDTRMFVFTACAHRNKLTHRWTWWRLGAGGRGVREGGRAQCTDRERLLCCG
jgi:hypothetical protein